MIFHHRVTIERGTETVSTSGEVSKSYATHLSGVRASIQPRSGSFRQREFGRDLATTHRGFFEAIDIQEGDRVIHGGVTYLVTFVANQFGHHLEADLVRVQAP